jgi:uncharacterized protein with HEPN domain
MPERKSSLLIKDILTATAHINSYTAEITFDDFAKNYMIVEACLYNIQVIGEAVSKLPEVVKLAEPTVPWPLIKGMRNRLIHEYFGTDLQLVWAVIKTELPAFKTALEKLYISLSANNN